MMAPWREEYTEFAQNMKRVAKEKKCSPHELRNIEEWPEFKW